MLCMFKAGPFFLGKAECVIYIVLHDVLLSDDQPGTVSH